MQKLFVVIAIVLLGALASCSKEEEPKKEDPIVNLPPYNPTFVDLNQLVPLHLPRIQIPADNPTTVEGIALGRQLFYEPLLSRNGTQSCGSCHNQAFAFTDNGLRVSVGIDGIAGNRNSMQIVNAGLRRSLFWDGRSRNLEEQALEPINNPIEMHETWTRAADKLNQIKAYREMSYLAFGEVFLDSMLMTKAIAQFERSLISGNSKFDKWKRGEVQLTPQETFGRQLFMRDREEIKDAQGNIIQIIPGADCFHCHGEITDFSDELFHNNGLDEVFVDQGRFDVTNNDFDRGKFKTPSLRNVEFTGPYMHDGRFKSLDEVIDFYSEGLKFSPTIDPLMKNVSIGGVRLNPDEKAALKAFLLTLSDEDFLTNPDFGPPPPL
ncbi:MAG: cytochrome c peroxidase [Vicingaceae bacterium]